MYSRGILLSIYMNMGKMRIWELSLGIFSQAKISHREMLSTDLNFSCRSFCLTAVLWTQSQDVLDLQYCFWHGIYVFHCPLQISRDSICFCGVSKHTQHWPEFCPFGRNDVGLTPSTTKPPPSTFSTRAIQPMLNRCSLISFYTNFVLPCLLPLSTKS